MRNLASLEELYLGDDTGSSEQLIANVKHISNCTKLQTLVLGINDVDDLSPLGTLTKLELLFSRRGTCEALQGECSVQYYHTIDDLQFITKLPNIKRVWFNCSEETNDWILKTLPDIKIGIKTSMEDEVEYITESPAPIETQSHQTSASLETFTTQLLHHAEPSSTQPLLPHITYPIYIARTYPDQKYPHKLVIGQEGILESVVDS